MKNSNLLIFPLMVLLLNGCAMKIKSSELPELSEEPGYLLEVTSQTTVSGDEEIMKPFHLKKGKREEASEFYSNYIKMTTKIDNNSGKENTVTYLMYKNDVTYLLNDNNGVKSKSEADDPEQISFKLSALMFQQFAANALSYAQAIYGQMRTIEETANDPALERYTLTRTINTYALKVFGHEGEHSIEGVMKFTIKNNYFSSVDVSSKISKDKKSATTKGSYKFTFGAEERRFAEAKMPNPANFA